MQIPVQVTFRNMTHSNKVEEAVRERAAKLDQFHPHIMGCRVVIEPASQRHRRGGTFHVRIDVTVKGSEIVVGHEHGEDPSHEDPYVAVGDAFDAARRRLMDHAQRVRSE